MKPFPIILISVLTTLNALGQQPEYPDSGFTNKAEAKNLIVNGVKEGKWVEYFHIDEDAKTDTNYSLTVYKADILYGIARGYWNGKLMKETPYVNGKIDGVMKNYDVKGVLVRESHYTGGKKNGIEKGYLGNGVYIEIPYIDGKINGVK